MAITRPTKHLPRGGRANGHLVTYVALTEPGNKNSWVTMNVRPDDVPWNNPFVQSVERWTFKENDSGDHLEIREVII